MCHLLEPHHPLILMTILSNASTELVAVSFERKVIVC